MFQFLSGSVLFVIVIAVFFLMSAIKILNEYERGVIFRLGRALHFAKGPGLIILIPMVDRLVKVNLQLVTYDVPSQDVITRDNVTVKVNAVVYFRVIDPLKAIIEVRDYLHRHPAAGPDHPAERLRPGGAGRVCWPNGRRSTPSWRRSWTSRPIPGASR